MIYLISGPGRSGKTTVARMIRDKTGSEILHGDVLREFFKVCLTPEDRVKYLPQNGKNEPRKAAFDDPVEVYKEEQKDAENMKDGFEKIIQFYAKREELAVFEGVHLLPEYMHEWREKYQNIKPIIVYRTDKEQIYTDITENKGYHDWHKDVFQTEAEMEKLCCIFRCIRAMV